MSQQDSSTSKSPFFPVVEKVIFKPMAVASERGDGHLPPGVARFISLVSLGAVLLGPLSGCGGLGNSTVPCPTPKVTGTAASTSTPIAKCSTSGGTHYVWIPTNGGWVQSDDGVHPNPNAHGVGEGDAHSGVGDGEGGSGHGGSDGG